MLKNTQHKNIKTLSSKFEVLGAIGLALFSTGCATYTPQPNAAHLVPVNTNSQLGSTARTGGISQSNLSYINYQIRMRSAGLR